jgi:hypothetical protein
MVKMRAYFDGNGRVGSFVLNREMERAGQALLIVTPRLGRPMGQALRTAHEERDLSGILRALSEARIFTRRFPAELRDGLVGHRI